MKNTILLLGLAVFCFLTTQIHSQGTQTTQDQPEQLNLPGDNLNLYAVMKLFQETPTLEEFEKKLNDESTKINNLDLDGDNQIDYIKVVDNADGETHNIALKVAVNKDEDQDVAVFVVKKDRNGQVLIQLIGDEDLYGKDYIIEPDSEAPSATPNPGYAGNESASPVDGSGADYQVSSWPVVQFIYVPTYSAWRSPWRWGAYPSYWHPWTPFFWHEYYGYHYNYNYYYHAHYRYTPVYRFPTWREHYYGGGFRSRSNSVEVRVRAGNYHQTYTRPDLANRGADLFRRDNPRAPQLNRPLPHFDNNNNNRPIITRPNRGGNGNGRPGEDNTRPVTRPGNPNPGNPNPGNGNGRPDRDNNSRPVTRPVTPNPGNPNPVAPNPGNGNNRPYRPDTRPVTPAPNPGGGNPAPGRPITRPVNPSPNPGNGNNTPNRPVIRPVAPNPGTNPVPPANGNNAPNRPVTRPVNPNANPNNGNLHNRPAPVQPAPRPTPANGNNMPNRPVSRPVTVPRQQEQRPPVQPANRPANERPARDRGNNR